jgi:3-hydroxyisobutyrate dehydrogenase
MRITVLGTGIMGAPMARNLAKAGHDVTVWNRTREKAQALAEVGAIVADTPAQAVEHAEAVITMLADGAAVKAVAGQALDAFPERAIWWQSSTVGIADTEELAQLALDRGVPLVDGPVLGTRQPAEAGQLIVLASGPAQAIDRLKPVFDPVSSKVVRLGEAGEGTRLKLVLNHWLVGLVENLAETIALSEALGIDPRLFLDTIKGGSLDSPYAQLKGKMMITRDFETSFPLRLARKDAALVVEAARRAGLELGLAPVIVERFNRAIQASHGNDDLSAAYYGTAKG